MNEKIKGIVAEFKDPAHLLSSARIVADQGYRKFDCYSPFPIHGMDEAMKLKRSPLGWMVGICALSGAAGALWLQGWTSSIDYPLIISGKPFFSYQAFVPVTFGLAVLSGALAAVVGMLLLNRLPQFYHAIFHSDQFSRFSTDGFFISIESDDPLFSLERTREFLHELGATHIEILPG